MKFAFSFLCILASACVYGQPGRLDLMTMEQKVAAGAGFHQHRSEAMEGFLLIGNIYYVGARDLASYLITTPSGHFLIDTGVSEMTSAVRGNIENLGFRLEESCAFRSYSRACGDAAFNRRAGVGDGR